MGIRQMSRLPSISVSHIKAHESYSGKATTVIIRTGCIHAVIGVPSLCSRSLCSVCTAKMAGNLNYLRGALPRALDIFVKSPFLN
jgi:hypothetical protein